MNAPRPVLPTPETLASVAAGLGKLCPAGLHWNESKARRCNQCPLRKRGGTCGAQPKAGPVGEQLNLWSGR